MACTSCKKSKQEIVEKVFDDAKAKPKNSVKDYILKSLLFLVLLVVLTPVILVVFVVTLFRVVILSKEINLLPLVYHIGKKIFKDKDDEEEDEDDDEEEEFDGPMEDIHELAEPDEIVVIN